MPSLVKESMARELTKRVQETKSYFLTGYQGLSADKLGDLRKKLGGQTARFMVIKNSVAKKVFEKNELNALSEYLTGPSAMTFVQDNPETVSKILVDFSKDNETFAIRGAQVLGETWGPDTVKNVAALPTRDVLIARTVGQIKAPLYGFVGTLSGILRELVGTLSALQEKKAKEAGS